jgi:hypothetical protein
VATAVVAGCGSRLVADTDGSGGGLVSDNVRLSEVRTESDTAGALMQQELQRERLEQQHQQPDAGNTGTAIKGQSKNDRSTAAAAKAQMAHLVKTFPDWRTIDPNNPFRRWLATKDALYQAKINGTNSPREIEKAIALFRAESEPAG